MEAIVKNWGSTLRFIIILFVVLLVIFAITHSFADDTQFHIDYTNDKTLITIIDKQTIAASSVLPACDCWTNTGIEIRPGEEYEIKVSGKIHTTMDKMIKDAENDVKPRFEWLGPEGAGGFQVRKNTRYWQSDTMRQKLLLSQKANIGQVLFYIQKRNYPKPDCNLGFSFYNPDSIEVYNGVTGLCGKNNTDDTWHIWATVNDMLIRNFQDDNNKIAYLGGASMDTLTRKLEQWKTLTNENYNRLWFDDNFGNFVISAKIIKPDHLFNFWKIW